jgi:hydrogenase maturation protein HypF
MHSQTLPFSYECAVQHHRAHMASVLAERGAWKREWSTLVLTVLAMETMVRYGATRSLQHISRRVRMPSTTSLGRLFDTAAALLGFVRGATFEDQAAIWLEQLAKGESSLDAYPFSFVDHELDFRQLLVCLIGGRMRGRSTPEIARAFQRGIANGLRTAIKTVCEERAIYAVVLSGGVFQNKLLLEDLKPLLEAEKLHVWTNHAVPPNDGGIGLGQAALTVFSRNATSGTPYA